MHHDHEGVELILLREIRDEIRHSNIFLRELLQESQAQTGFLFRITQLLTPPQPLTASINVIFSGATMPNSLTLNVGQTSTASITPLLADGITPSGGTLSSVIYSFTDPSATVVLNADGVTALVTGVAASTGAVSGTAQCTVTDTDGAVATFSQGFTITTLAVVPPSQLTQSIAVNFTTPTP